MQPRLALFATALAAAVGLGTLYAGAAINPNDAGSGFKRGIQSQSNSGQVGEVTLFARGPKTFVVISLQGEPEGASEPAHIHRGHSCETLDPKPTYPLNPIVGGKSATMVAASAERLLSGNYVVNVHKSAKNIPHYVACGELTPGT